MARQHAYRARQNNPDEMMELIAGTSMPTGRIFRKVRENEDLTFKETVQVRNPLDNTYVTYVFAYIA